MSTGQSCVEESVCWYVQSAPSRTQEAHDGLPLSHLVRRKRHVRHARVARLRGYVVAARECWRFGATGPFGSPPCRSVGLGGSRPCSDDSYSTLLAMWASIGWGRCHAPSVGRDWWVATESKVWQEEHRTDVWEARSVGHDSHPPPAKLRGVRALALFRVWRNLPSLVLIHAKLCVQHCNHTSTWRASCRCCGLQLHALRSLGSSSDQVISLYRHAPVVRPYIYTWLVRILVSLPSLIPSHQSLRTFPPHPPLGQGSGTMGDDKATAAEEVHDASPPSLEEWDLHQVLPQHDGPWYKKRHLLVLNLCMVIPYLSSTTNGYDGSLLNGLQSMKQWQSFYNTPTGARLGSLSNGVIFGQILAFPVAPWLCERTGRRFPIFLGSLLLVIGAILQCASQNYAMFLVSRMIIGFGGLIAVEPSPMLVSELAYPTHRAVLVGYYNNLWYLGATLAAWVTYGTYFMGPNASWAWRLPSLLQGFLPLFQVLFIYFLPESPRWLVQRDRYEDARKVLVKYHAGGDENSPLVDFEMKEIIAHIETSKATSTTEYRQFLRGRGNLHRLFIIILVPCMYAYPCSRHPV